MRIGKRGKRRKSARTRSHIEQFERSKQNPKQYYLQWRMKWKVIKLGVL